MQSIDRDSIKNHNIFLINDSFQNRKQYNMPKAQLVLTDIPYNVGNNAYGSNPQWYKDGDIKNGESELAGKQFFDTDKNFNIAEFFHFCSKLLKPEPKETNKAGCLIIFCAFEQQFMLIEEAKKHGFKNNIPLSFYKNYSPQVLKANMRVVGNTEYALLFYRDKLPKFNNNGKMIFNSMYMDRDTTTPKIHPTQKPKQLMKTLIQIFTDVDDVVIDPCSGSGITLVAAKELSRKGYGFEIKKEFVKEFNEKLNKNFQVDLFSNFQSINNENTKQQGLKW
jgi:site-specific DNA-methyltransferase (adenine-specific)